MGFEIFQMLIVIFTLYFHALNTVIIFLVFMSILDLILSYGEITNFNFCLSCKI